MRTNESRQPSGGSGTAELIKDPVQSGNLLAPPVRKQKKEDIPESPIRAKASSDRLL